MEVFTTMVPAPLGFLEVLVELAGADPALASEAGLGVAPARLDAVEVAPAPGEFVRGMMDPVGLLNRY